MQLKNISFEGKVAVVTGSSRGWGLAIAQEFGKRGARVVVNGRKEPDLTAAAESVRSLGADCIGVVESVATSAGARRLVSAAVDKYGRVDILINNAGGFDGATILDMEERQWNAVIDVQLNGVFNCAQQAARQMVSQGTGGVIINMTGLTGIGGMYGHANHAATKGAILAATRSWAYELWPHRIRVNAVRAGVRTELMAPIIEQIRENLRRMGEPADVTPRDLGYYEPEEASGLVAWLSSESASGITGHHFGVDGPKLTHYGVRPPKEEFFHYPNWTPELIHEAKVTLTATSSPENIGAGSDDVKARARFDAIDRAYHERVS
jgi:NAD(P)-dependent dehydrogenase (short-subunit alcohol dehydrogenase family)